MDRRSEGASSLGVDVGGTKVRAAVQSSDGTVVAELTRPSSTLRHNFAPGLGIVITDLLAQTDGMQLDDFAHVGIGMPGVVEPTGRVTRCPAFPELATVDVPRQVENHLGRRVAMANDANLAALAEYRYGEHGCSTVASLALGTGVGLGLVIDGHLIRGSHGAAGEIADFPLRSPFGVNRLESTVSAAGLLRADHHSDAETVRALLQAARDGNTAAAQVVDDYCLDVAEAIAGLCSIVDPGIVVLTGGIGARAPIAEKIDQLMATYALHARLVISQFGDRAPLLGALALGSHTIPEHSAVTRDGHLTC